MKFVPRSENTRRLIIEACAPVFNCKGVAGTSITDLEKATGLTKGSIYGNFENKEAVALAVFDFNLEKKRNIIRQEVDRRTCYKDKLLAYVLLHYPEENTRFTPGGCPIQNTAVEADDTHEELRKRAAEGLIRWKEELVHLIENGIQSKEFKDDTNALGIAWHLIALIEGAALAGKVTREPEHSVCILDIAREVIQGICIANT